MINIIQNLLPVITTRLAGWLSYIVFKKPFRLGKNNFNKLDCFNPIKEKVSINNKECVIYKIGDFNKCPNPILLVHGWQSFGAGYVFIISKLIKKRYSFIVVDLPGHGLSEGRFSDIVESSKAIGHCISKFNVTKAIGHSYGAMAIACSMKMLKVDLEKMVLLNSPAKFVTVVDVFSKMLNLKPNVKVYLKKNIEKHFITLDVDIWDSFSTMNNLKDVNCLIFHDENDKYVDSSEGDLLILNSKNRELVKFKGKGHNAILRNLEVIEKISTFL